MSPAFLALRPAQALAALALATILGCQPGSIGLGDESDEEAPQISEAYCPDMHHGRQRWDLLFVIDDSPSMGDFLPTLAANLDDFVSILEAPGMMADYRIGITTTSLPGPGCEPSSWSPLRFESCLDHLDDFIVPDTPETPETAGIADLRELCEASCALPGLLTTPTTTDQDPHARPRPWIERNDLLDSNLPEGVSSAEAMACVALPGAAGCRFESPLEAMWRVIDASYTVGDPAEGFLRADASLMVVFLTSEDDCSLAPAGAEILSPAGAQAFWPDPAAAQPPSAVCWNAASACTPAEDPWLDCQPAMRDESGALTEDPASAVLHPVDRYADRLRDLEREKRSVDPDLSVLVALVGGVGSNGQLRFAPAEFTAVTEDDVFGIAAGCMAGNQNGDDFRLASPPLRLHALAQAREGESFSACGDDWGVALERIANHLQNQMAPFCPDECAADLDPNTPQLDHDCVALELRPDSEPRPLPECAKQGNVYLFEEDDYVQPDPQTHVCVALRTDPGDLSESPYDDLDPVCVEQTNVEIKVARRPGHPAPIDTCVRLRCTADESCAFAR